MASNEMKAWTFTNGYPSTLKQSTVPIPSQPKNSPSILVKIAACALNPVDIQRMNLPSWSYPIIGDRSPKGTGCDFSGTVVSVPAASSNPDNLQPGDEVFGMTFASPQSGTLAQHALFDRATSVMARKPADWSHATAAAVPLVWLTAQASVAAVAPWLDGAHATSSRSSPPRLAVLGGSSATGAYTTVLAKRRGWTVAATSSGANRDFVLEKLGADVHIDYTARDVRTAVREFKPTAIVDCVGGTECVGLPSSRRYVTIVGDKTGRASMGGPYTYNDWFHPVNAVMQWVRWFKGWLGLGEVYDVIILDMKKELLEEAKETLKPENIHIDSVFAFDDAKKAFDRQLSGRAKGKVIVEVHEKTS